MIRRFVKRPVEVEAVQLQLDNRADVAQWCGGYIKRNDDFVISTLEGEMTASIGDYVIKGVQGEFYPCKPDIFEATYEEVGGTTPPPVASGGAITSSTVVAASPDKVGRNVI